MQHDVPDDRQCHWPGRGRLVIDVLITDRVPDRSGDGRARDVVLDAEPVPAALQGRDVRDRRRVAAAADAGRDRMSPRRARSRGSPAGREVDAIGLPHGLHRFVIIAGEHQDRDAVRERRVCIVIGRRDRAEPARPAAGRPLVIDGGWVIGGAANMPTYPIVRKPQGWGAARHSRSRGMKVPDVFTCPVLAPARVRTSGEDSRTAGAEISVLLTTLVT